MSAKQIEHLNCMLTRIHWNKNHLLSTYYVPDTPETRDPTLIMGKGLAYWLVRSRQANNYHTASSVLLEVDLGALRDGAEAVSCSRSKFLRKWLQKETGNQLLFADLLCAKSCPRTMVSTSQQNHEEGLRTWSTGSQGGHGHWPWSLRTVKGFSLESDSSSDPALPLF